MQHLKILFILLIKSIPFLGMEQYMNKEYSVSSVHYNKECLIMSKNYKNHYLYAVNFNHRRNSLWRNVNLWAPLFSSGPKEFTDKNESAIWVLKVVADKPNTYFILNKKYDEYLFAMEKLGFSN